MKLIAKEVPAFEPDRMRAFRVGVATVIYYFAPYNSIVCRTCKAKKRGRNCRHREVVRVLLDAEKNPGGTA